MNFLKKINAFIDGMFETAYSSRVKVLVTLSNNTTRIAYVDYTGSMVFSSTNEIGKNIEELLDTQIKNWTKFKIIG
jgi:hypothetical protein